MMFGVVTCETSQADLGPWERIFLALGSVGQPRQSHFVAQSLNNFVAGARFRRRLDLGERAYLNFGCRKAGTEGQQKSHNPIPRFVRSWSEQAFNGNVCVGLFAQSLAHKSDQVYYFSCQQFLSFCHYYCLLDAAFFSFIFSTSMFSIIFQISFLLVLVQENLAMLVLTSFPRRRGSPLVKRV